MTSSGISIFVKRLILLFVLLSISLPASVFAQIFKKKELSDTNSVQWLDLANIDAEWVEISTINIDGNKKTKPITIHRELDFSIGDTLRKNELVERFAANENQVFNTTLFNYVKIGIVEAQDHRVHILIVVEERWYTFVWPVFELADRNFNVWWKEFNHDFGRTKYGFIVKQKNMRGRNETLWLGLRWGYSRRAIGEYEFPFINKKRNLGLYTKFAYIADREVAYNTTLNKYDFYEHTNHRNNRYEVLLHLIRRKALKSKHTMGVEYYHTQVVDTIKQLNPQVLGQNRGKQDFMRLVYQFEYDNRDIRKYPLKGNYLRVQLRKDGLGLFKDINSAALNTNYSHYFKLNKWAYLALNAKARISFSKGEEPFFNQFKLGLLDDFVRGYEFYVIPAQHHFIQKTAIKFMVLDVEIRNPIGKSEQFKRIPLQVLFKVYNEMGWVHQPINSEQNPLNQSFLNGFGFGFDIFTSYDMLFGIEYSFNRQWEKGLYLHFNITFDFVQ